jgi:hypothetical protein
MAITILSDRQTYQAVTEAARAYTVIVEILRLVGEQMPTKSLRLSEAEAEELERLLAETGEAEETVLRRAALRGIRDLRLEQGIQAFSNGQGSTAAADVAGLPRAVFLQILIDRGITVLDGPSHLGAEVEALAGRLGDEHLVEAARIRPSPES